MLLVWYIAEDPDGRRTRLRKKYRPVYYTPSYGSLDSVTSGLVGVEHFDGHDLRDMVAEGRMDAPASWPQDWGAALDVALPEFNPLNHVPNALLSTDEKAVITKYDVRLRPVSLEPGLALYVPAWLASVLRFTKRMDFDFFVDGPGKFPYVRTPIAKARD